MEGFITFDQLKTFAGQLFVVTAIGQTIKSAYPAISTYLLRAAVVVAAIGVNVGVAVSLGGSGWLSTYLLAPINGLMVALAAMQAAQLIKGDKNDSPPPSPGGSP